MKEKENINDEESDDLCMEYTVFNTKKKLMINGVPVKDAPPGYDIITPEQERDIMWASLVDVKEVDDDNDDEYVEVGHLI